MDKPNNKEWHIKIKPTEEFLAFVKTLKDERDKYSKKMTQKTKAPHTVRQPKQEE